jgi:hypothetical protein
LAVAFVLELLNLFAIAITRGALQILPLTTDRFWSFAAHGALAWLFLAVHDALRLRGLDPARRQYAIARLVLVAVCLVGAAMYFRSGIRLSSDGPHYFVQARSLLFDHDLDFANDYQRVPAPRAIAERYPVGMALLSMPFLVLGHLVLLLGRWLGFPFVADGFGTPYETAFDLASYCFGALGLLAMLRTTSRFFSAGMAFLSVVTVWAASFLIWYMVVEPSMPHAMSAAWTAFLLSFWLDRRPFAGTRDWIVVGAIAGVAALVRWQNGVLLALPLLDHLLESRASWRRAGWAALTAAVCFLPQLVFWQVKAHSPLALPLSEHGVHWGQLSVLEVLFSTNRGLFTWSPVTYLGAVGLLIWAGRARRLAVLFLLGFLLEVYVNSSVAIWWSGWSFGSRRFENCLLFFAIGLGAFLEWVRRRPLLPLVALCGLLCLWNLGLMRQSREGKVPPDRLVSFEDVAARNLHWIYAGLGLPSAAPANWLFGWRYGVSPERFDRLFGHEGFGNLRLPFDADSTPFVGRGWGEPERDTAGGWFRWCVGNACTLLVPLRASRSYSLAVHARPAPGTAPNWIALGVNGTRQPKRLLTDEGTLTWRLHAALWRGGVNELRFDFDRTARPADLGPSSDSRPLAAGVYGLELLVDEEGEAR